MRSRHSTLRRLAMLLALAIAWTGRARAQEVHYEPPPVDRVYPVAPGEELPPVSEAPGEPGPAAPGSNDAPTPDAAPGTDAPSTSAPGEPGTAAPSTSAPGEPGAAAPTAPAPSAPAAPTPPAPSSPAEFGVRASVQPPTPGEKRIELQSARDLPGAFGDPLRIIDAMPGVVPIASGVPYAYVRGAPPAATGYVYDDIPLPQLFHAAFGPAVVHPRAIGSMHFFAGVPPARYGRRAGGLMLAEAAKPAGRFTGEVELRLIDLGLFLDTKLGTGQLMVSGRIGYPKLALLAAESIGAVESGTKLNYWDGQVRYGFPVGKKTRAELLWLGSFDNINLPGVSDNVRAGASRLEFHRVETRLVHSIGRGELGTALRFGYDDSELGDALKVRALTVGPRVWSRFHFGKHTLRAGAEIYTSTGQVDDTDGTLASPDGDIEVSVPQVAEASARNQGGLWTEAKLITSDRTRVEAGLRLDYWSVRSDVDLAVDPRLRFVVDAHERVELHAAFGMAHQPAVFLLPVPGLTDIALDKGLTRSIQSEVGAKFALPQDIDFEIQGFLHHYDGLLLPELVSDGAVEDDPPLSTALAYGVETFLKRDISRDLSGWVSYTLGYAWADSGPDVIGKFRPDFDVRHVLNVVAQWRIWRGLALGGRFQARSGRLIEQINPRYTQRLPWFVRADMRIGYKWPGRYANMLVYFEWLNMLVRREYLDADCFFGQCRAQAAPPISIPNLGVRAEF